MACPSPQTLTDKVFAFTVEASTELSQQQDLLDKVRRENHRQLPRTLISLGIMLLSSIAIILYPKALWSWFIVSLFLYSWNFIFLLIPTTSEQTRPKTGGAAPKNGRDKKWLAAKVLLTKKKLAVEIGLTLFLGRMVPLTMSFTLILGMGMAILVYFVLTAYTAASGLTVLILFQVVLIISFYILVNVLQPQAQGISAIARSWKKKLGAAKNRGRKASFLVKTAAIGVVAASASLFIGALVLPGITFLTILSSLREFTIFDMLLFIGLFAAQLWVMRSFQSVMSRRMAFNMLNVRIDKLQELMAAADRLITSEDGEMKRADALQNILGEYYCMMVYDIYRLDFFGRSPVYLVGPRPKYVLDEKVLCHVPG